MQKMIFFIFFFFYALSLHAEVKPKLVLFTLHGFIADEETFCDWKEILKEEYGEQIAPHDLVYSSLEGDNLRDRIRQALTNDTVTDFTKRITQQITDYYKENHIDIDTPYAFLTHSQGGIIAMRYVTECVYDNRPYCTGALGEAKVPKKLKYFIAMSTPYWGSSLANRIKFFNIIEDLLPVPQVVGLSMGSSIITYNREMSLYPLLDKGESIFPEETEVISISADFSKSFLGSIFKIGTETGSNGKLEHDLAVPVFSANIDYHYKIYPEDKSLDPIEGKNRLGDYYYPITGYHSEYGFLEGIACLKKLRKKDISYKEKTNFLIIKKHLDQFLEPSTPKNNQFLTEEDRFVTDLQTFNMEVKLNLPPGNQWFHRIHFSKYDMHPFSNDASIVDLTRSDSWFFHRFRGFNYDNTRTDLNYVTYYHTAFFEEGLFYVKSDFSTKGADERTAKFGLDIDIPWFQPARVEASVSPANTTFVEYNLEPIEKDILSVDLMGSNARKTHDGKVILAARSGLLKTKLIQMRNDSRGTIEIKSLEKKSWAENSGSLSPESISSIYGECYEATVSSDFYAADIFYQGFYDEVPQKLKARANKESKSLLSFRIYGRWGEGHYDEDSQLYERDRVLVSSKALVYLDRHTRLKDMSKDQYLKNTYYWVDTDIIRLIDICK